MPEPQATAMGVFPGEPVSDGAFQFVQVLEPPLIQLDDEIVEGRLDGGAIREARRISYAPRAVVAER